jgi:hypothetical protein
MRNSTLEFTNPPITILPRRLSRILAVPTQYKLGDGSDAPPAAGKTKAKRDAIKIPT